MGTASPESESESGPEPANETTAPSTPGSIYLALALMLLAVASPFIGEYEANHSNQDSWHTLRVVLKWLSICAGSALAAIVSTVVGARQEPRTLLTKTAILLCLVMVFALLVIIGSV